MALETGRVLAQIDDVLADFDEAKRASPHADLSDGLPEDAIRLKHSGTYNALVHKQVIAWLGLRNDAAHGKYDEYDHKQVGALIRDVRDFMARHPA